MRNLYLLVEQLMIFKILKLSIIISIEFFCPLVAKLWNLKLFKISFQIVFLFFGQKLEKVRFWAFGSPRAEKGGLGHNDS